MAEEQFAVNLAATTPPINLIFLDIDGVLNSTLTSSSSSSDGLDVDCLARLLTIIKEANAFLVLSTSWRLLPALKAELGAHFLNGKVDLSLLVGQTPERPDCPRAAEIVEWVGDHTGQIGSWVVLDDIWMDGKTTPAIAGTVWSTILVAASCLPLIDAFCIVFPCIRTLFSCVEECVCAASVGSRISSS